jgi:hypothetical protein
MGIVYPVIVSVRHIATTVAARAILIIIGRSTRYPARCAGTEAAASLSSGPIANLITPFCLDANRAAWGRAALGHFDPFPPPRLNGRYPFS